MPARTSPRKVPRQERSRLTVEAILDAAARVFERHGYAAGTTNRIAERAGVSIGSLYQYFPNKDAILVALVQRHLEEGVAVAGPVLAGLTAERPPVDVAMRRLVEAMVALHRERPALHRVLFEEAPRPPALRRRLDALEDAAVAAVSAYLRERDDVGRDPELAARMVARVVETVTHELVLRPRGVAVDAYVDEAVVLLTAYLTTNRDTGVPSVTPEA
ncbi:MAG TPA: TetR/AcrR family transcriptional regulator [Baekduia sp.]|uniref:TetR/AcrR family transcriptional regulator n=1 Tax=Baekduia sp. TaxID=2600305 RepID=UPI002D7A306F|nr:TetR/AcrR family transcriptional regulator [Baekduia sp.]HET6507290.1 TetR/AcrR family transcriptional regulator [Baekduia sp.]